MPVTPQEVRNTYQKASITSRICDVIDKILLDGGYELEKYGTIDIDIFDFSAKLVQNGITQYMSSREVYDILDKTLTEYYDSYWTWKETENMGGDYSMTLEAK